MTKTFIYIFLAIFLGLSVFAFFQKGTTQKITPPQQSAQIAFDQSKNTHIFSPTDNQIVGTKFILIGKARVFENTFTFRLKNIRTNKIYAESSTMTDNGEMGQFGDFNFEINFAGNAPDIKSGDSLLLEVFQHSPKDGTEIDKSSVILKYTEEEKQNIKLYFINPKLSKNYDCSITFPIERSIEKTPRIGQKALEELLAGPTDAERAEGYNTSIDPSAKLKKLTITKDTAFADFSDGLEKSAAGSCKVESIRSQITQTLTQFPGVKNVVISVNGMSEGILQP